MMMISSTLYTAGDFSRTNTHTHTHTQKERERERERRERSHLSLWCLAMADSSSDSQSPEHHCRLPSLTHHCILHAVEGIAPRGINAVLPQSGSHNISSFCKELAQLVRDSSGEKSLPLLVESELVSQISIQNFFSDVSSEAEFASEIEKALVEATNVGGIELERLHRICWEYYREAKKGEVSFPKWLTSTCTYQLWQVFNQCLEDRDTCLMTIETLNEILRRLIEMCSYTWNDTYRMAGGQGGGEGFTFPQFLEHITDCFEKFDLNTSLTAEVITDLLDETVNGVLKKGFLEKKGHVRRNWRRRWFILKRTILCYYCTGKRDIKGEVVLNTHTKIESLPDKGNRRYMFLVTCGVTDKPLTIAADDQKMKHDWMLAIKKAIALAQLAEGGSKSQTEERKQLEEALSGFFLLKYGTDQPRLSRQDSDILHIKHHTSRKKFKTIQKIAMVTDNGETPPTTDHAPRRVSEEQYVEMRSSQEHLNSSSDSDDDEYCHMERVNFASQSSSEGGLSTPSTANDSLLNFSLPLSASKDVFKPERTGLKSPDQLSPLHVLKEESDMDKETGQTGLEDSYYEECTSDTARYIPEERYVDIKHHDNKFEESGSPKATPTHVTSDPSYRPDDYLTIIPSPQATPPPEIPSSPTESVGPAIPPRRSASPHPPPLAKKPPLTVSSSLPPKPLPPARNRKSLSSLSPVRAAPPLPAITPSTLPTSELSESMDYREDVGNLLKKFHSSGQVVGTSRKPVPPARPPRLH